MIDVVLCIKRRADLSEEEFHRYWREDHARRVARHAEALGVRSYVQHHTTVTGLESIVQDDRGCPPEAYDGIAVISFDSLEDMAAKGAEPAALEAAQELAADERTFIDHAASRIFFTDHVVVV